MKKKLNNVITGRKPLTPLQIHDHVHHHLSQVFNADDCLIISAFRYRNGIKFCHFYNCSYIIKSENLRILYRPIKVGDIIKPVNSDVSFRSSKNRSIRSGADRFEHVVEPHNNEFKKLLLKQSWCY